MPDNRNSYKGQTISLELYEDEISGSFSSIDQVIIFQDKEICYSTTAITLISPGTWSITVNTDDILYIGEYHDYWVLDGGTKWVEKTFNVSEAMNIPVISTGEYGYYSKDISYETKSDGDLYRIYNETSIAAKIEAVVMTIKGSLYNEPSHGTNIYRFLFAGNTPNTADRIRLELEVQLPLQVPMIKIASIDVQSTGYNAYTVFISFYILSSSTPQELLSMTNLVSVEQVVGA